MPETDRPTPENIQPEVITDSKKMAQVVLNTFTADLNTTISVALSGSDMLNELDTSNPDYEGLKTDVVDSIQELDKKLAALRSALADSSKGLPVKLIEQTATASGRPEMSIHLPSYYERQPDRNF